MSKAVTSFKYSNTRFSSSEKDASVRTRQLAAWWKAVEEAAVEEAAGREAAAEVEAARTVSALFEVST